MLGGNLKLKLLQVNFAVCHDDCFINDCKWWCFSDIEKGRHEICIKLAFFTVTVVCIIWHLRC